MTSAAMEHAVSLDVSVLAGDWRNTNAAGRIVRIVCEPIADGRMRVHSYSATSDWGSVDAPVFAFTFEGDQAGAFLAIYDLGSEEIRLQANVKSGVLVVVVLTRYLDESGRSNYFDREFFYRTM